MWNQQWEDKEEGYEQKYLAGQGQNGSFQRMTGGLEKGASHDGNGHARHGYGK